MADAFHGIHFNVVDQTFEDLLETGIRPVAVRGQRPDPADSNKTPTFTSAEPAARFYLRRLLERDTRREVRGLAAAREPEVILRDSQHSPLTDTWIVRFVQTQESVPIFGSRATVELDRNKELLAIDAELANVTGTPATTGLTVTEALDKIAAFTGVAVERVESVSGPSLVFYYDNNYDKWYLAYHFRNVPAAPANFFRAGKRYGIGSSLAELQPEFDYLIDAHDGSIRLYWSTATYISVPTSCQGHDEDDVVRAFFGSVDENNFIMRDPMRNIKTYDYGLNDVGSAAPAGPVTGTSKILRTVRLLYQPTTTRAASTTFSNLSLCETVSTTGEWI